MHSTQILISGFSSQERTGQARPPVHATSIPFRQRTAHARLAFFLKMVVMLSGFVAVPGAQIYYETYLALQLKLT